MGDRLIIGKEVLFQNKKGVVHELLDMKRVKVRFNDGNIISCQTNEVEILQKNEVKIDLNSITPENWEEAKRRKEIIEPLLNRQRTAAKVKEVADKSGTSMASIYRWIKMYEHSKLLSALLPLERSGGKGKSRINPESQSVIDDCIHRIYLKSKKKSIQATYNEISRQCSNLKIPIPSASTVRLRILSINEYRRYANRFGDKAAKEKYAPKLGNFPNANWPLETVQIDHTQLDIFIVEKETLEVLGKPWLSLAIDVYSRMIVGYYLSFDSPSSLGTGICIANSILSKDQLLNKLEISADWPCHGIMDAIHTDNGSDFRSHTIERSCQEYGIATHFRPVGLPEYGGHIERLLGTVLKEIHTLDGTTFGKPNYRKNYLSEKEANLTLLDLEKWLVTFFTKVYHLRKHSAIGTSPLNLYKQATLGSDLFPTAGIPRVVADEKKLYLDFLPSIERSINQYGVVIDKIFYYSDVLRNYIHAVEKPYVDSKKQIKKQFRFRRDPRNLSRIFFFDATTNQYYEIPYRNMEYPEISIWDLKAIRKYLEDRKEPIDEAAIFRGYNEMKQIEELAQTNKRKKRKNRSMNEPQFPKILELSNQQDELNLDSIQIKKFKRNG